MTNSLLRRYLLAAYTLLILYVSLSPFSGWQEQGLTLYDVFTSPLGLTYTTFDAVLNCLAYIPFGALLALTLRSHFSSVTSMLLAIFAASALSCSMEFLQMYLPSRTSSNVDVITNSLGGLLGALLAWSIAARAWFARIVAWREELFWRARSVDFGLALTLLWMFAQINPSLPMLGNVFITDAAHRIFAVQPEQVFNIWESAAVALNLLMMGLLMQTLLRVRHHAIVALVLILALVGLAKFISAAVLLKSWALLLWLNGEAMLGIVVGLLLMWFARSLHGERLFWLITSIALIYVVLAFGVLDSGTPSSALALFEWRYGHMRNYNGLSQTLSVMFPLLLGLYLLSSRHRL